MFKVDGWDIKTEKVAYSDVRKEKKKEKKNLKSKKLAQRKRDRKDNEIQLSNDEDEEEEETSKSDEAVKDGKVNKKRKVEEIKNIMEDKPSPAPARKLTPLQQKMMAKLTGSRFRWINEQLYTISSEDALKLVSEQPQLFDEYHDGFRSQVQAWPENPVDVFVDQIRYRAKKPVNAPGGLPGLKDRKIVIADMGCGEAQLALDVNTFFKKYNKKAKKSHQRFWECHSFDLKAANERITVADIRNVPLPDNSCTIVVFCLALMGTNFLDFIKEAYRILAPRGELWIAEIKSRFGDGRGDEFVNALKLMGFFHKKTDDENKMFTRFEFFKPPAEIIEERKAKLERRQKFIEVETEKEELEKKRAKTAEGKWLLKPCIYKRR
ncbi:25S rRNA (adenine(645)-N(1))-methyltransferase [Nakaseomyces bracarensis]|uniref:Ribosomal RNA-processing protein 8 n=1 Tax=Nakaseomyces bracarensis TaxID=273131 RepID=A0ABR4NXS6_9SACH